MIYIFQRIIQNHFQWTRPSPGRLGPSGEGEYVQKNGFGHEDWNFNKNLVIDGFLYGYCYYRPSENKRNEKFNIAYATYTNKRWYLTGFYLNAEFVNNPATKNEVLLRKKNDLLQLGNSLGASWRNLRPDHLLKKLKDEAKWLKWRVSPDDAIRVLQPIEIPKNIFDTQNYRIVRPKEIDKRTFDALYELAQESTIDEDYGYDEEFPEGREVERRHKLKERNQAIIKKAKELFKKQHGRLYCQVCGFDFYSNYGEIGFDFIEGHHTLPISELKTEVKTKVKDIALVCSNCHRMLHRKRPWLLMSELKKLIKENA